MKKNALLTLLAALFITIGISAQQVAPFKKGD